MVKILFSQNIKKLRKERKMSQSRLAQELQVTQQAVGKWETGKSTPDSETLRKIAEFFKTSVDFLHTLLYNHPINTKFMEGADANSTGCGFTL